MAYESLALANEFILRALPHGASHLKLQKLVYSAHGWWLSGNDRPIIHDPVHAWSTGPVFPALFSALKKHGHEPITAPQLFPKQDDFLLVPHEDRATHALIDWIWDRYKNCDAATLASQCHRPGTPWDEVYDQTHNDQNPLVIPDAVMKAHYMSLAESYSRCFPERDLSSYIYAALQQH